MKSSEHMVPNDQAFFSYQDTGAVILVHGFPIELHPCITSLPIHYYYFPICISCGSQPVVLHPQ